MSLLIDPRMAANAARSTVSVRLALNDSVFLDMLKRLADPTGGNTASSMSKKRTSPCALKTSFIFPMCRLSAPSRYATPLFVPRASQMTGPRGAAPARCVKSS